MSAITVCFGANASITNRGSSIKDLIKAGANFAEVTIRMPNSGRNAYEHDIFGDWIIVKRRIYRDKGSIYELKDEHEVTKMNRRHDVERLCEFFNIKVDNPLVFLNQDAAREFLSSATPGQKYMAFYKGAGFQKITQHLERIAEIVANQESVIKAKKAQLQQLEDERKSARLLYQSLKKAKDSEAHLL